MQARQLAPIALRITLVENEVDHRWFVSRDHVSGAAAIECLAQGRHGVLVGTTDGQVRETR